MFKTFGKIIFLLASVAVICQLFWIGWKDATRPEMESPTPAERYEEVNKNNEVVVSATEENKTTSASEKETTTEETTSLVAEPGKWVEEKGSTETVKAQS